MTWRRTTPGTSSRRISICCALVGVERRGSSSRLPTSPRARSRRIRREIGPGPFALINPGAAWPNKRWPAARFGEVAAFLREVRGLPSVVLWGPGELPLAQAVVAASSGAARAAPPTEVPDLVALARQAALMVSGDTGPLHIAAAVGTPVVALFGPTNPQRNGPWSAADVTVSRFDGCGCPYERKCHEASWCLESIGVAEVTAAIQQRLGAPLFESAPLQMPLEAVTTSQSPHDTKVTMGPEGCSSCPSRHRVHREPRPSARSAWFGVNEIGSEIHVRRPCLTPRHIVRRLARYRVRLGFAAAAPHCGWRVRPPRSLAAGAAIAVAGEGASHLGGRPPREGPRGHRFRTVSPEPPSALSRVGDHRRWLCRGFSQRGCRGARAGLFDPDVRRRHPQRRGAPDREVRRGLPGLQARAARRKPPRRFSLERAIRNREYRAAAGLLLVLALLAWKVL